MGGNGKKNNIQDKFLLQSKFYCKSINLLKVQLQSLIKLESGSSKNLIVLAIGLTIAFTIL